MQVNFHLSCEPIELKQTGTQKQVKLARYWEASGSEATQEDDTVVLVDHSTEGRKSRESGEVKPERPTVGKEKPGITY